MTTGVGLKLKHELSLLAKRHRIAPPVVAPEPELPPCDEDAVILSGYASNYSIIDHQRMRFSRHALCWWPDKLPQLWLHHRPGVIGEIKSLQWDDKGLAISVQTSDPAAMNMPAFSVAATVLGYELKDTDKSTYYAEVRGWIDEISLVTRPVCADAVVWHRTPTCAAVQFFTSMQRQAGCLQKLVELLQQQETQSALRA